jgi:hypothetical protein
MFNAIYNQALNELCSSIKKDDSELTTFSCTIYKWEQMKKLREAVLHNHYLTSATINLDSSIEKIAKYRCIEFKNQILQYLTKNSVRINNLTNHNLENNI